MFDIASSLGLITSLLPIGKAFTFVRYLPVALNVLSIVSHVDANHDGTLSGDEKLAAAKALLLAAYANIPGASMLFDQAKAERIINLGVSLMNEITGGLPVASAITQIEVAVASPIGSSSPSTLTIPNSVLTGIIASAVSQGVTQAMGKAVTPTPTPSPDVPVEPAPAANEDPFQGT